MNIICSVYLVNVLYTTNQFIYFFITDKSTLDDTAHSLYGLKKIASNYECIPSLLDGLADYIRIILTLTDNVDCPAIDKAINELMNQVLQVFYHGNLLNLDLALLYVIIHYENETNP